jgi:hypothetical protein
MITAEQLGDYQYTLGIDDSFSMILPLIPGQRTSRWEFSREMTSGIAVLLQGYDADGTLDGMLFSDTVRPSIFSPEAVDGIFGKNPTGKLTNLHLAIEEFGRKIIPTLSDPSARHMLVIVTDGEPTDKVAVARAIVEISRHMQSDEQVAIGFIAACRDEKTMGYLQTLDDELQSAGAKFDIVSWVLLESFDGDVEKMLVKFVNN